MNRIRRVAIGTVVLALTLGLAACGDDDDNGGASPETTAAGNGAKTFEGSITLAVNPWDGSAANANVAKIVLEKQGMTVKLTDIDENAVWPALDSGSIDANLEVWPSGHAQDFDTYITQKKSVVDGGLLGVTGQIGWYVPKFVVDENPDFATWEGLKSDEAAQYFKTAETGDLGQFLLGDPSYVSYDADIIKNLDLPFKVVVGGSEATLITQLDNALKDKTPLLFYFYNPQWKWADPAFADAVTQVELPEITDECTQSAAEQGKDGKYACAYPPDELYKAISADLESKNPAAFGFLQKFELTDTDQNTITSYKNVDDMTIEEAAQKWVDENESTWQEWLT
jgi:glycine betaine/proline transport system substrate-binding protein